eukprot:m.275728 g.275728  ORF g.275728 m.275728 type:complete len:256 (+) comp16294_c1_seq5:103-870(+)
MKITLAVVLPVTLLIQYLVSSFSSSSTSSPAKSSSTGSKEREITMAEVAQHTTAESLWMVINGDVVDVTAYMKAHPGGPDVLAANGGSDATKAFKEVPHSPDATKEVLKWKIGVLAKAKKISPDELAKRNTANDLWLAIDGKVVDVTKFAKEHPGGEGLIIEWAGKDGTKAFKDAHHSPDAVKMLQDYFVGDLAADGTQGVDLILKNTPIISWTPELLRTTMPGLKMAILWLRMFNHGMITCFAPEYLWMCLILI